MLAILAIVIVLSGLVLLLAPRRRRKGEPFDWTHRRRWWRPRWAFPDDR